VSRRLPLEGVLVADFSRVLAGPLATMTLADLGATVIKVERPGSGDDTRAWGPPWTTHASSYFECVNRSKRSVVLDLADPDDRAKAQELARRADVVVENFRPGVLGKYGLDYESVRAANPGVIYCSITGFGREGGAHLTGYDFVVQAVGGLMHITGHPDGEPTKVGVALVDVLTGKDAVIGILAALRHRERTGEGQRVEVDLFSSCLGALVNQAAGYLATGRSPGRLGNQHPSIAPYQTLRCADGLLAVAVGNDAQFRVFTRILGRPELADDPRFATNPARVEHRDELAAALEAALAARRVAEWEADLRAAGIPCGQVNDIGQAIAFATELGLEPVHDLGEEYLPQVRNPVRLSATPPAAPAPPPRLGEHTDEVLAWLSTPDGPLPPPLRAAAGGAARQENDE
jgi:crotonobetainyl-CoA:carnitine CoA-transferase CaiB-like acyl-CoA transferase